MSLLPQEPQCSPSTLWSPEFILLFLLATFANSYIAVFYSFEHWLAVQGISPQWRGFLLSAMGIAVLCMRPLVSVWLLRHRGLVILALAILTNSAAMCTYALLADSAGPLPILALRLVQGVALAAFSSAVVALLVECIPQGQSARGFALFSLTMLLPYSIIPGISEQLLPLVGGEARLYSITSILGIPALIMIYLLSRRLRGRPNPGGQGDSSLPALWAGLRDSGLGPLFWASGLFGCGVVTVIFFIKGLCSQNGASPGAFFMVYTGVVMLTRLLTNKRLDALPRLPTMIASSLALSLAVTGFALAPGWALLPLACVYGLGLGLLYPMIAAAIYDGSAPERRSLNSNIMMLSYDASNVCAPLIGGGILSLGLGYTEVFLGGATLMLLAALSARVYQRRLAGR